MKVVIEIRGASFCCFDHCFMPGVGELWERTGLPKEVAELSLHFRQLLGFEGTDSSPVQRLRLTDNARNWLFGDARLWADTKGGVFAGKQCEWTDVHLVIFPHGAILSVAVDWMSGGGAQDTAFSLSDLRSWVYVAKFRSIKVWVACLNEILLKNVLQNKRSGLLADGLSGKRWLRRKRRWTLCKAILV